MEVMMICRGIEISIAGGVAATLDGLCFSFSLSFYRFH